MREGFLEAGACRAATANDLLPAVDGGHGTSPACKRFLEVELDYRFKVIPVADEDGVGFLRVLCKYLGWDCMRTEKSLPQQR